MNDTRRNPPEIHVFPDAASLYRAAAELFTEISRDPLDPGNGGLIALAGGSTPQELYRLISDPENSFRNRIPWETLRIFWSDERHVPLDDPRSNYRMAREHLLDRVSIPETSVFRVPVELQDTAEAAARYESVLQRIPTPVSGRPPGFDLIILGMGADGHTASLFPENPALFEQNRWVLPVFLNHPPPRITFTYPLLNAARNVMVLVTGPEKADTVRKVLQDPAQPYTLPVQGISPAGNLLWFLDRFAAGKIT